MNQRSEKILAQVHPELQRRVRRIADKLAKEGYAVELVQGLRSISEQNALYAQGRTRKGPRVTDTPGGYSQHNYGLAVDFALLDSDGKPSFPDPHPVWEALQRAAHEVGLDSGSDWHRKDKPHVEIPHPDAGHGKALAIFHEGGMKAVWEAASRSLPAIDSSQTDSRPDAGSSEQKRVYTVQPGDTLSGLASFFYKDASTYQKIIEINNLTSTVLSVGQKLIIP